MTKKMQEGYFSPTFSLDEFSTQALNAHLSLLSPEQDEAIRAECKRIEGLVREKLVAGAKECVFVFNVEGHLRDVVFRLLHERFPDHVKVRPAEEMIEQYYDRLGRITRYVIWW